TPMPSPTPPIQAQKLKKTRKYYTWSS
uniref:L1 capsid protein n=1 Tax=Bursaphelenchus xylophilus TaxID=6326 RepID=A0A1I7SPI8_BURXY